MTDVAAVYAQSLYALAKDENCSDEILQQMVVLRESFGQEPEFVRLLCAPNLTKEERCGILDDSFRGKVHPYVLNFMKILTQKGYMRQFADCAKEYRQVYNRDHGILEVCAVTAIALTEDQKSRLTQKLVKITGKTIDLVNRVDKTCLGGVRLDYDGKRLDDTVSGRLAAISALLKNTVL